MLSAGARSTGTESCLGPGWNPGATEAGGKPLKETELRPGRQVPQSPTGERPRRSRASGEREPTAARVGAQTEHPGSARTLPGAGVNAERSQAAC